MPYIKPELRTGLYPHSMEPANNAGELAYQIFCLLMDYFQGKPEKFQIHADIIGALEGAKLEWYRRETAPFEERKMLENEDVF